MYDLGLWTYVIALTHYGAELLIFRGCKFNGPFMSPLFVAGKVHKDKIALLSVRNLISLSF